MSTSTTTLSHHEKIDQEFKSTGDALLILIAIGAILGIFKMIIDKSNKK